MFTTNIFDPIVILEGDGRGVAVDSGPQPYCWSLRGVRRNQALRRREHVADFAGALRRQLRLVEQQERAKPQP